MLNMHEDIFVLTYELRTRLEDYGLTQFRYDVVVAGAGIAGSLLSRRIASQGYKVALIEAKKPCNIGMKVCGEGIGLHDFQESEVDVPTKEVERTVQGVKFFWDSDTLFTIHGKGVTLNRHLFGQRLLKEAQDHGAELYAENIVTKPLYNDVGVTGFVSKCGSASHSFQASITVDATGISGCVRKALPSEWPVSEQLRGFDIGLGYREYRRLPEKFDDYCALYYDWRISPGGYCWIIPKKERIANTGLLIPWKGYLSEGELQRSFEKFVQKNPSLERSESMGPRAEVGLVPLRHPLPSAVAGGFLAVGDAACHANPINGDGIGPAMYDARIAADVVTDCLSKGDYSTKGLWKFNLEYMKNQGRRYAMNKVLADFMRKLEINQIEVFLKALAVRKVYHSGSFLGELSASEKLRFLFKLSARPSMLRSFLKVTRSIQSLSSQIRNYPEDPSVFPQWVHEFNLKLKNVAELA